MSDPMEPDATRFPSKKDVTQFVQAKALEDKKPYRVSRSDSRRFHIRCPDDRCPFQMRFCARKDGVFRLILHVAHTCTRFKLTTPAAFIQDLIRDHLEENPAVTTAELRRIVSETTSADVSWKKVHYSRRCVEKETDVCTTSFRNLSDLMRRVVDSNPGSVTDILLSGRVYKALFICPGACIHAFNCCHPMLFVDGCHVKAQCGGVLLFASSIDGNGQLVPIAMAHVPIENGEYWRWFLRLLSTSLSLEGNVIVVMSDRENGLAGVVEEALLDCYHAFCVRHIIKNFVSRYKVNLTQTIWSAASTHSKERFTMLLEVIRTTCPKGYLYLKDIPAERWANSHFQPDVTVT